MLIIVLQIITHLKYKKLLYSKNKSKQNYNLLTSKYKFVYKINISYKLIILINFYNNYLLNIFKFLLEILISILIH